MRSRLVLATGLLVLLGAFDLDRLKPVARHFMPRGLIEISGLAVATPDSVFAHNDEHAIVYEVDLRSGKAVRAFALGDPTIPGDFEGIAVRDGRVYLITSDGMLYEAMIGAHRDRVRFHRYDTGVGAACEVEGLSASPEPEGFLILCKRAHEKRPNGQIEIYSWDLEDRTAAEVPAIDASVRALLSKEERRDFRPSGIEWDEPNRRLLIVSARAQLIVALGFDGSLRGRRALISGQHPQAEGITLMPDGRVVVADEGAGQGPGRITIFEGI
ncbi:MAG: SdiA-regulated domain-containing protein [Pseudomonadota bacterium]